MYLKLNAHSNPKMFEWVLYSVLNKSKRTLVKQPLKRKKTRSFACFAKKIPSLT